MFWSSHNATCNIEVSPSNVAVKLRMPALPHPVACSILNQAGQLASEVVTSEDRTKIHLTLRQQEGRRQYSKETRMERYWRRGAALPAAGALKDKQTGF
jgi:hypothetical protein